MHRLPRARISWLASWAEQTMLGYVSVELLISLRHHLHDVARGVVTDIPAMPQLGRSEALGDMPWRSALAERWLFGGEARQGLSTYFGIHILSKREE
ncbi:hypothetical protein GGR52DRAFT_195583 [Hypoxylon sp. FL1284]|nr:hypothetical protein GGR52DRAFT_195583 [Hypoxylon sp. FL1284]